MPIASAQPTDTAPRKGVATRLVHVAVPLVVTGFVFWWVGAQDVLARLAAADLAWVIAALLACSAQIVLCALRWQLTAARLAAPLSTQGAVAEYYLSSVINTTVPGGVVGDALRAVRIRGTAGLERAAQSVVIERLAGQLAFGATLLVGLALSGRPQLQLAGGIAMGGLASIALLVWFGRGLGLSNLLPPVVVRFANAIRTSWFDLRAASAQIALSLLIVGANLAAFAFAARATGAVLAFPEMLYAVPLILAAMLIPFSVAGWGYREGAAAAVFPIIGATAAEGVATSVLFGTVILVASLPGIAVWFLHRRTKGRQRVTRRQTDAEAAAE
ncbi:MAG: lysylphosphatidylglycerol synthase transmembrane domain-containing protein [Pseudomonadota bacterium]